MSSHVGVSSGRSKLPRAVIHKKILDEAESRPGASVEAIADDINGASVELVERVFGEYGDPAAEGPEGTEAESYEDDSETSNPQTDGTMSKTESNGVLQTVPERVELTEKQRAVLRAIRESPDATQSELAEQFGVTQSTINNRLNTIEGFDWKRRHTFIEAMFEDSETPDDGTPGSAAVQDLTNRLDDISEQVSALERRLEESEPTTASPFDDPDLACSVVRACMDCEDVDADEEDRILKALITGTDPQES